MTPVPRSEEQIAADDALTAAVDGVLHAYSDDTTLMGRYLPSEYLVIATHMGVRDGEEVTMTNVIFKDNDVPITRALGLARYGQLYLDRFAMGPDE